MSEEDNEVRLHEERKTNPGNEALNTAKTFSDAANPIGAISLSTQIKGSDWPYGIAFGAALLKDILDFGFIGSLPGIGTAISFLAGITIFFMMLLAGSGQQGKMVKGMIKKSLVLAGGTLVEAIGFGLNFLPIETLTVIIILIMALGERKRAKEAGEKA
jgi:hypothetical protein